MSLFPASLGKLRFLPFLIGLLFVVAILSLSWFFWQQDAVSQLRKDIEAGNVENVEKRAEPLEALSAQKREVQKLKALALASNNPKEALSVLDSLINDPTAPDYPSLVIQSLGIAIENGYKPEAERLIDQHRVNLNHLPDFLYWQARLMWSEDKMAETIRVLDRIISINSEHYAGRLLRAKILLDLNTTASLIQAKVNLRIAARGHGAISREALRLLAFTPNIPLFANDRLWLAHELREHAASDPEMGVIAADFELSAKPEKRDALIASVLKNYGNAAPAATAAWLFNIQAFPELKALLNSETGQKLSSKTRWQYELELALALDDYEAVQTLLNEAPSDTSIEETERLTLLAVAETKLSAESSTAADAWQNAFEAASQQRNLDAVVSLAKVAAQVQWWTKSQEAYEAAIDLNTDPAIRAQLLTDKITVDLSLQDTATALQDVKQLLEIYPQHSVMLNNLYYLSTLLNQPPPQPMQYPSEKLSKELDGYIWSTYAFYQWRAGNAQAARDALAKLPAKYRTQPSSQLVAMLVAMDVDDLETARTLAKQISPNALLPEEKQLLEQARQKLQS